MSSAKETVLGWSAILSSDFQNFAGEYEESLVHSGYHPVHVRFHLHAVVHFGVWLEHEQRKLSEIDDESLQSFERHRSCCTCPEVSRNRSRKVLSCVRRFREHLRQQGIVHSAEARPQSVRLVMDFLQWMKVHRGIAETTLPGVYSTLFGLLACTGLGISEALNLRLENVTTEGLVVRNTKFGKSRLLALHPSTRKVLEQYIERRSREAGTCPYLFVSLKGRQLHATTTRGVFRRLVGSLGIAGPNDKPRPRLHDLRFYFANQVMTSSPGDHAGISRHMVALTTYLGHSDVRNSYWYLEASPELLSRIAAKCESFVKGEDR